MIPSPSARSANFAIAAVCAAMIALALYLQHGLGLQPCYLCIVQRVCVLLAGAIALIAAIHAPGPRGVRAYGLGTLVVALSGAGFSLRHLWLQQLPADQVPACGPPANYLFDAFPLAQALPMLLQGDGNCAAVDWSLGGVSLPGWALLGFIGLASAGALQVIRPRGPTARSR